MTNPPEDHRVDATAYTDAHLLPKPPGSCYSESFLLRALAEAELPESETTRRVRWAATAAHIYDGLNTLYQELRDAGEAYAWAAAYEATALAGFLRAEVRAMLIDHQAIPPTQEPGQEPTPPATQCGNTQHCAAWGWCRRCDTDAARAGLHMVQAVDAMHLPASAAGEAYAAAMAVLRRAARPLPPHQQRARCSLAQTGAPGHYPHPWEPQPGMTGVICPGSGIDQDADPQEEETCPGK